MTQFADPNQDFFAQRIILASGTSTEPVITWANDLSKGFYYDVDADMIKATGFDGGSGATVALDNLALTAINSDLLPGLDGTISLGNITQRFVNIWLSAGIQTNGNTLVISSGPIVTDAPQLTGPADFHIYSQTTDNWLYLSDTNPLELHSSNPIHIEGENTSSATFDGSINASETRMMLWDVDSGSLQRVTVGAADSGGTGFKVLRIPN